MIHIYPERRNEKTSNCTNFYVVETDVNIKRLNFDNKVFIFYGTAFNHAGLVSVEEISKGDPAKILENCGGGYALIIIDNNVITIYKSIYRTVDVYFRKEIDGYCISDELSNVSRYGDVICSEYCECFINGEVNITNLSPYKEIYRVIGGTITELIESGVKQKNLMTAIEQQSSINEQLDLTIKSITKDKKVSLYLSGGFDSKLIFHNLISNNIDFDVFHFSPYSFENDSEIDSLKKTCIPNGISYHLLNRKIVKNRCGYNQRNISSPFDVGFVKEEIYGSDKYLSYLGNDNHIFLNGHGGDSVFVQNPSRYIGVDYFLKYAPLKSIRKMVELSMLKSCSLSGLIKYNAISYLKIMRKKIQRPKHEHPWLAAYIPGTAMYEYLSHIIYMTETTPIHELGQSTMFSPILSPNIFMRFIKNDYGINFNHKYDRLLMRKLSYDKYQDKTLFDIKKRSSSTFIFHALLKNKDSILNTINNGELCEILSLDKGKLNNSLEYNTKIGFDENTDTIINLHRLQSYYNMQRVDG